MGKTLSKVENKTSAVDLDDLQYTIRYDDANKGHILYASDQRNAEQSMGTMRKNMVSEGILLESENDLFWELLDKIGGALLRNHGFIE